MLVFALCSDDHLPDPGLRGHFGAQHQEAAAIGTK
jgi:hypothetical protein